MRKSTLIPWEQVEEVMKVVFNQKSDVIEVGIRTKIERTRFLAVELTRF